MLNVFKKLSPKSQLHYHELIFFFVFFSFNTSFFIFNNIIIGVVVWEVVSCSCPQADRSVNEKEEFYDLMDRVVTSEKVLVGGDFNGHVGSDMGGFGKVHGGMGVLGLGK